MGRSATRVSGGDGKRLLHFPPSPSGMEPLPLRAVIPGLVLILGVDLAAMAGAPGILGPLLGAWSLVAAILPWATILVLRRRPSSLGYVRGRWPAEYGWGMVAGAAWRGLSMGFSALWASASFSPWLRSAAELGFPAAGLLGGLVWVPLVEETFFRGYLGPALATRLGRWPGILTQAVLFALHPGHWAQGWPALAGIFAFGVLAGWLVEARRTIWIGWGAHGFANVLPSLLALFA